MTRNATLTQITVITLLAMLTWACQSPKEQAVADLIITNGNIYTVDEALPTAEAVAIKDGRILAVGTQAEVEGYQGEGTELLDAEGQFIMPGFIEGHGHFSGLGYALMNLNFLNATSWDEIVQMVAEKAGKTPEGEWITGRGWHQEKWKTAPELSIHGYPSHHSLSVLTKDHPVFLFEAGRGGFQNLERLVGREWRHRQAPERLHQRRP